ncbi:MAG: LytTR family transcriptional regulator [Defluviitaleaceae bacterium]|nr:LytTR family transcriptional regulator [Defluviitaleaceae bacterium]
MKIIIEEPAEGEEEQIIVKCRSIRPEIMNLLATIKAQGAKLTAYLNGEIYRIEPSDVFYIETVDNRVFFYCKTAVYESKQKLYELEGNDFFRISKSVILNLGKIKSLRPSLSGRLEAVLQNDEIVTISRQYVSELKKLLGI